MAQQTAVLAPSAGVVRWQPPAAGESGEPECRTVWRDNVVSKQDFQAAHPGVIWPHRERTAPWDASVPIPEGAFLEAAGSAELGRLPSRLAIAVARRDARCERAA
jgi:hypothetical protein